MRWKKYLHETDKDFVAKNRDEDTSFTEYQPIDQYSTSRGAKWAAVSRDITLWNIQIAHKTEAVMHT